MKIGKVSQVLYPHVAIGRVEGCEFTTSEAAGKINLLPRKRAQRN